MGLYQELSIKGGAGHEVIGFRKSVISSRQTVG